MPASLDELLPESAAIDIAAVDPAARLSLAKIPAKGAVYLLMDAAGTPMLLATVRNLRAALERRLTDTPAGMRSSRLQYGQLCTTLRFRIVHSPFAANFHYLKTARALFPQAYRGMVTWRQAWFVAIDLQSAHPRFRKTSSLADPALTSFGPIPDKHAAARLVESLEDLFDLCRYHTILIQAPHGKACAYKEMGKCPAPCDGTIPMSAYFDQLHAAAKLLYPGGLGTWRTMLEDQMKDAAARLDFEAAAKIKARLSRAAGLSQHAFAHLAPLAQFSFLSLQPGPGIASVQPFFIHGGAITEHPPLPRKKLPAAMDALFQEIQRLAFTPVPTQLSPQDADTIALVSFHLFRGTDDAGLYLPAASIRSPTDILTAAQSLLARRASAKPLPDQSSDRQQEAETAGPALEAEATESGSA